MVLFESKQARVRSLKRVVYTVVNMSSEHSTSELSDELKFDKRVLLSSKFCFNGEDDTALRFSSAEYKLL